MKPSAPQSALHTPLNEILGAEANVRVLRELFRHGGALAVSRLAQDAGMSRPGIRAALTSLRSADVVTELGAGRSVLYQINHKHPLSAALEALLRAEEERTRAVLDAVRQAVQAPEIIAAWIYGSVARGEDTLDSDLDLAVLTEHQDRAAIDRVREALDPEAERLHFTPSIVGIDLADVDRMKDGDPWWKNLTMEALVIKGNRPETLQSRRRDKRLG
jgi:predicted nucleotidyltransferase